MSRQVGAAFGVAIVAAVIGSGAASGVSITHDRAAVLVTAVAAVLAVFSGLRGFTERVAPSPTGDFTSVPPAPAPVDARLLPIGRSASGTGAVCRSHRGEGDADETPYRPNPTAPKEVVGASVNGRSALDHEFSNTGIPTTTRSG
jgi:hypothetical protein